MLTYVDMVAYAKRKLNQALGITFIRFCVVGAWGFGLNFALLTTLYKEFGLSLFISQLIAGEIALFNNFLLHHHWTYKKRKSQKAFQDLLVQFHATSWVAIVGTALIVNLGVRYAHLSYFASLVIGGMAALAWNYMWSKFVIWKHDDHQAGHLKHVEAINKS